MAPLESVSEHELTLKALCIEAQCNSYYIVIFVIVEMKPKTWRLKIYVNNFLTIRKLAIV